MLCRRKKRSNLRTKEVGVMTERRDPMRERRTMTSHTSETSSNFGKNCSRRGAPAGCQSLAAIGMRDLLPRWRRTLWYLRDMLQRRLVLLHKVLQLLQWMKQRQKSRMPTCHIPHLRWFQVTAHRLPPIKLHGCKVGLRYDNEHACRRLMTYCQGKCLAQNLDNNKTQRGRSKMAQVRPSFIELCKRSVRVMAVVELRDSLL
mmetsp:Transcript_7590/g.16454  ORF Transcript_7590/g.16454 Transcript_7590/m.16454 type:complete len:202 (+) Transcript_7590:95-700(+)